MRSVFILIGLLFLPLTVLYAQPADNRPVHPWSIGGNAYAGFAVKHDQFMGHLSQGITHGFEMNLFRQTTGRRDWEQVFRYPEVGFSLSYFDYGSEKLGQSIEALAWADLFIFRSRKMEGFFRLGTGLAYHTHPYDPETNNQNVALGSPVTQSMKLRTGLHYHPGRRWRLTTAITLSHFSLAAITQPNKGINVVTANLGCSYRLYDREVELVKDDPEKGGAYPLRYHFNFNYGIKEVTPIGSRKFPVYSFSFYIHKQLTRTNVLNLGLDGFNNTALMEEMRNSASDVDTDHKRVGIVVGHELKLHRLYLITQFGAYIYRPYKTDQPFYQRVALKYYVGKHFFVHYGFITHYAKADHPEWGIGIVL